MLTEIAEHDDGETVWRHPFEDNTLPIQMEIVEESAPGLADVPWLDRHHLALCRRIAGGN